MNILGKVVELRAIELEDLELMREMLNDPEIESWVVGWAFPVSKAQQHKWYESNINDDSNQRFIISTPNGPIGLATLTNIDWKNRRATHGIKIARRENRGRGIGTDAVMAIMRYAFDELQLNRLEGSILDYNEASRKLYCGRCGWSVEGVQRTAIYKNGAYHDLLIVGILRSDYDRLVEKTNYWG